MIITFHSHRSFNQLFAIAKWTVTLVTLALSLYFLVSLFKSSEINEDLLKPKALAKLDFEQMLTGPLGLYESQRSPLAAAFEQKLILLVQRIRPDLGKGVQSFCIGIKGTDEQRLIGEGEPIFFNLTQSEERGIEKVEFSENRSGIRVIPHILDGNSLVLKAQGEGDEEIEVLLHPSEGPPFTSGMDFFAKFQAKWWGNDLFFSEYGGFEYQPLGSKHKLEFNDGARSYFLYVGPKDCMTLKEGKWEVLTSISQADPALSLAVVQSVSGNELEIEGWDEKGVPLFLVKLTKEKNPPFKFPPENQISLPKLRSRALVFCKLGKRRMVLKPGDWVLKTPAGWRKLTELNEIEAYLNHVMKEELFVVDAIAENGQLTGRHFDQMRMQMKPFTIHAAVTKAKSRKKKMDPTKQ